MKKTINIICRWGLTTFTDCGIVYTVGSCPTVERRKNMNTVKNWVETYESEQEVPIKDILKSLYAQDEWEELHIALWAWLSLDGNREKTEWFDKFDIPEVKHYCFACEEAEISFYLPLTELTEEEEEEEDCFKPSFCNYCPITNSSAEECLDGLYYKWLRADLLEKREELAREIASLEWNIK